MLVKYKSVRQFESWSDYHKSEVLKIISHFL